MTQVPGDLEQALAEPGCPVCRLARRREEAWIWHIFYELTGDPGIRRQFDATQGFCSAHARLMARVREQHHLISVTGIARMYETVVLRFREGLEALPGPRGRWPARRQAERRAGLDALEKRGCMLCQVRARTEEALLFFLLQALDEKGDAWWPRFEASDGLCNPHLLGALREERARRRPALWARLVSDQERRLADLQERLHQLQRKFSYDVHEAISDREAGAWQEAVWRFSGMEYDHLLWHLPGG